MSKTRMVSTLTQLVALLILGMYPSGAPASEPQGKGVSHQVVADYIQAIIEADRTLYSTHVVHRMQETGTAIASESWKERNALPLPAQMLQLSGDRVKQKGLGLTYRLASLWPIYRKNGPQNAFERQGLEAVRQSPEEPFTGYVTKNDKPLFVAIYADMAVSESCVNCHNRHLLSPRRDQKIGDVMGGIIISFPINPQNQTRPSQGN